MIQSANLYKKEKGIVFIEFALVGMVFLLFLLVGFSVTDIYFRRAKFFSNFENFARDYETTNFYECTDIGSNFLESDHFNSADGYSPDSLNFNYKVVSYADSPNSMQFIDIEATYVYNSVFSDLFNFAYKLGAYRNVQIPIFNTNSELIDGGGVDLCSTCSTCTESPIEGEVCCQEYNLQAY